MPRVRCHHVKKVGAERKAASAAQRDANHAAHKKAIALVGEFDANQSGKLERAEVAQCFEKLESRRPSEIELDMILKRCDTKGGGSTGGQADGAIDATEVADALAFYRCYTVNEARIVKAFEEHDTNKSGTITKDELTGLTVTLNGGEDVSSEEVQWILTAADQDGDGEIQLSELKASIIEWYTTAPADEQGPTAPPPSDEQTVTTSPNSSCCEIQ